jgi:hypothetical protein
MTRRSHSFELVTEYGLSTYPCGARAGDKVRIKISIVVRDHRGKPTGKIYPKGQTWTILSGVKKEPDVIWLRDIAGDRHTWDATDFFDTFELIEKKA